MMSNEFTHVLKKTNLIAKTTDVNSKVDKMWERLLEIAIFVITKKHRKPVDVLKGVISSREPSVKPHQLNQEHLESLRKVFRFLKQAYSSSSNYLGSSKLATDMTHFYTMVTTLLNSNLIETENSDKLIDKLIIFSDLINKSKESTGKIKSKIKEYLELSVKHTTDVDRRKKREDLFLEIIKSLT
mgnify:CR=1 FL=1